MHEIQYTITDENGIHARPAGQFVAVLQKFSSAITVIKKDGASCDGKKLFTLMKLRVKANETITVRAEGDDEEAAVNAAAEFLKANM
ncbi:MAG: HPr family phosphocarrier protein [Spirochaetaceae bacterium]|jgi:phosphocarrier protein|nr:HPr family phosphocarrier protein [Spirochaetaceae bacterium]